MKWSVQSRRLRDDSLHKNSLWWLMFQCPDRRRVYITSFVDSGCMYYKRDTFLNTYSHCKFCINFPTKILEIRNSTARKCFKSENNLKKSKRQPKNGNKAERQEASFGLPFTSLPTRHTIIIKRQKIIISTRKGWLKHMLTQSASNLENLSVVDDLRKLSCVSILNRFVAATVSQPYLPRAFVTVRLISVYFAQTSDSFRPNSVVTPLLWKVFSHSPSFLMCRTKYLWYHQTLTESNRSQSVNIHWFPSIYRLVSRSIISFDLLVRSYNKVAPFVYSEPSTYLLYKIMTGSHTNVGSTFIFLIPS